jgi:hypothetical protein
MRRFVSRLVAPIRSLFNNNHQKAEVASRNELHLGYNAENEGEYITLPLDGLTHTHFKGMTGYGKSSLLAHSIASLVHSGVGVCFLDPIGTTVDEILSILVNTGFYDDYPDALERVVYLPLERGHTQGRYMPFNFLNGHYDAYASSSVALKSFKGLFDLEEGGTINIITAIHLGAYALAEHGLPLLPHWRELFSDPNFYQSIVPNLKDQDIRRQFEVMKLEPFFYVDKTGHQRLNTPELADNAMKRMNRLIFSPHVRHPLSQKDNLLDPAQLIQSGRSVLLNLGISDPHAKSLLGALVTQAFEQTSRTFQPIGKHTPYVLAIEELGDFTFENGRSLETMFAMARHAGVAVWVIHQYDAQLSDELNAALSQCATKITFRTGYEDAVASVRNMGFPYDPYLVKEVVGSPMTLGGQRAVYFTEAEQVAVFAREIMELAPQEAFIERQRIGIDKLVTFSFEGKRDEYRIEQLTRLYLDRYFRSIADIEGGNAAVVSPSPSALPIPSGTVEKADPTVPPQPKSPPKTSVAPPPKVQTQQEQPANTVQPASAAQIPKGYDPLFDYNDGLSFTEDQDEL